MSESASGQGTLARLVLFMICLSLAASAGAGIHYYAIDLPAQNALIAAPPPNVDGYACGICVRYCISGGTPGDVCVNSICQGSCK